MSKQFEHMQKLAFGKVLFTESKMTKAQFKAQIREMILDEAKKKKKEEEPTDVAPQEDIDIEASASETPETTDMAPQSDTGEIDVDPKVKAIQDALQKALANAKQLGDEKLVKQLGNTLTMLVRTQVLGGMQNVAENKLPDIIKRDYPLEQNPVVTQYLAQLRDFEKNNTDDLDDFKNLATAVDLYHKELLNKIKEY